jgi:hypothetical protein
MRKTITALIVLVFSFGVAASAFAWGSGGEPTSCYKWSYDSHYGYIADRGDYYDNDSYYSKDGHYDGYDSGDSHYDGHYSWGSHYDGR